MFITPTLCGRTVDTAFHDDESYVSGQPTSPPGCKRLATRLTRRPVPGAKASAGMAGDGPDSAARLRGAALALDFNIS
jgi:hypothetical protein